MAGALPSDQFVQSLARGLAVIEAFDAEHPEMSLSEVAAATGLSRAAARQFRSRSSSLASSVRPASGSRSRRRCCA